MGHLESCGGISFLNQLSMRVPTAANVEHYARIVQKRSQARKLIKTATTIATSGYDESADVEALLDQAATQILDLNTKTESGLTHMKHIVQDAFAMIEERFKKKEAITGVPTGFHKFDDMTAGFQPGDLIIVAGRPSMGKTALALNMAQYAALKKKVPTAVFSLEMSKESLVMRMLTSEGRINGHRIRAGMLKDSDWPRLARACGLLAESPVYIDDLVRMGIRKRSKCIRLHQEKGLGLIVIDYLQLMSGKGGNEGRERKSPDLARAQGSGEDLIPLSFESAQPLLGTTPR